MDDLGVPLFFRKPPLKLPFYLFGGFLYDTCGLKLGSMLWNGRIANGFCVLQVNTSRLTASTSAAVVGDGCNISV